MRSNEIKKDWDERAFTEGSTLSATTDDIWLRNIEMSLLMVQLKKFLQVRSVLDIGCGDDNTVVTIAKKFPNITFVGSDYSEKMIQNAKEGIDPFKNDIPYDWSLKHH